MSDGGRDLAKGAVLTLAPTGLGFILSGWAAGVICLFIAGGLSLILWTPLGGWLGFHSTESQDEQPQREPPFRPGDLARRHTSLGAVPRSHPVELHGGVVGTADFRPASDGRIYGSGAIRQAIVENARREDRATVEAEFVTMIEEGNRIAEEEFTRDLSWFPYGQWRKGLMEFIGAVFGAAERQRFIEVKPVGPKPRDHIIPIIEWLRERRDDPDGWTLKLSGDGLAEAVQNRRAEPGRSG